MDVFRPRPVQALSALLSLYAAAASADCESLAGGYRDAAAGKNEAKLTDFIVGKEREKFQRIDRAGSAASFTSTRRITAAKTTNLASRVELVPIAPATRLRVLDARGNMLVEASIDVPERWKCDGSRLVRSLERMSGVGDDIRTERIDEALERNGRGELVYRESVTVIEGKGKARSSEARFAPAP